MLPKVSPVHQLTPAVIRIGRRPLTLLERLCSAADPEEGCALLLGSRLEQGLLSVERVWPCCNVWQPAGERRRHFLVDPRESLQAQRWGRDHGLLLLGAAHSHPTSEPQPSLHDRQLTAGPALQLILGRGGSGQPWRLGCWWLDEEGAVRPLVWTMED